MHKKSDKHKVAHLFNRWSIIYDNPIVQMMFNPTHALMLKELRPHLQKDIRLLDVGCGTGKFLARLARQYPHIQIDGIDISPGMVTTAKAKLSNTNSTVTVADAENIPYDDETLFPRLCTVAQKRSKK